MSHRPATAATPPRHDRRAALLAAALALVAAGAVAPPAALPQEGAAHPQDGWMLPVARDQATGQWSYVPDRVDVYAGSTVLIGHLYGPTMHSITSVDGRFNATGNQDAWPQVSAPMEPGEYPFYCWVHAAPGTKPGEGRAGVMVVHPREGATTPASPPADADATPRDATPAEAPTAPSQPSTGAPADAPAAATPPNATPPGASPTESTRDAPGPAAPLLLAALALAAFALARRGRRA